VAVTALLIDMGSALVDLMTQPAKAGSKACRHRL
jgi:hypothetical protein